MPTQTMATGEEPVASAGGAEDEEEAILDDAECSPKRMVNNTKEERAVGRDCQEYPSSGLESCPAWGMSGIYGQSLMMEFLH